MPCGWVHESDDFIAWCAGLLNSAYDTVSNTASSVVSGSAKLVQNTANYVGDTAEKFTKK